jgi:hypothetical protein
VSILRVIAGMVLLPVLVIAVTIAYWHDYFVIMRGLRK